MKQKDEDKIAQIFCSDFPDPYNNPRIKKARALYELAAEAPAGGRIVELGTQHGCGASAMALGLLDAERDDRVYTIDDYKPRSGWVGEPYGPADKIIYHSKTKQVGVQDKITLIAKSLDVVLTTWRWPIGMLFWDVWGDRLTSDFENWSPHIVKGGIYAIHVPGDLRWGAGELLAHAVETGKWERHKSFPGGFIWTIKRVEE